MQKFVGVYVAVAAAAISLASYSAAQASPLPLFTDHGDAWLASGNTSNDYLPSPGPFLGASAFQTSSGSSSSVSIDDVDSARLTASATTSSSGPYQAGANVDLEFYFRVTAPQGYVGSVAVSVAGAYFMTTGSPYTAVGVTVCPIDCTTHYPVNYPDTSAYFTETGAGYTGGVTNYELSFSVSPDVIYEITIIAQVAEYGFGQSDTAWIDPIVSVDPNFQLELSPGISNGQSATPLPAALPLFATGLGAMGVLGWRRSQKGQRA
jgi:hypothetical protein